jgi:hypothetical protein
MYINGKKSKSRQGKNVRLLTKTKILVPFSKFIIKIALIKLLN